MIKNDFVASIILTNVSHVLKRYIVYIYIYTMQAYIISNHHNNII